MNCHKRFPEKNSGNKESGSKSDMFMKTVIGEIWTKIRH
jgi:hypothetical protein